MGKRILKGLEGRRLLYDWEYTLLIQVHRLLWQDVDRLSSKAESYLRELLYLNSVAISTLVVAQKLFNVPAGNPVSAVLLLFINAVYSAELHRIYVEISDKKSVISSLEHLIIGDDPVVQMSGKLLLLRFLGVMAFTAFLAYIAYMLLI